MAVQFIDKGAILFILEKKTNIFIPVYFISISKVDFGASRLFCKRNGEESIDL